MEYLKVGQTRRVDKWTTHVAITSTRINEVRRSIDRNHPKWSSVIIEQRTGTSYPWTYRWGYKTKREAIAR